MNEKIYNSGLLCLFTLSPSCLVGGESESESERDRERVGPTRSDRGGAGGMGAHPASCAKKLPTTPVGLVQGLDEGSGGRTCYVHIL